MKTIYTIDKAIKNALECAKVKKSKGLLITCNDDELNNEPATGVGDVETVYSIMSQYVDDENNDGSWSTKIGEALMVDYLDYF
jgi:hypothetical protein